MFYLFFMGASCLICYSVSIVYCRNKYTSMHRIRSCLKVYRTYPLPFGTNNCMIFSWIIYCYTCNLLGGSISSRNFICTVIVEPKILFFLWWWRKFHFPLIIYFLEGIKLLLNSSSVSHCCSWIAQEPFLKTMVN